MKAMLWVGVVGGALLLIFVVWLAVRNWTPEIYRPVASILIGSLVALLITLLTVLRGSEEERRFVSSVVIDNRTHLPAVLRFLGSPLPDVTAPAEHRITSRHAILGQLTCRGTVSVKPDEREDAMAAEFFEYKLLHDLAESQGPESKDYILGTDEQGIHRMYVRTRKRILPPRAVLIETGTLQQWFKGNRLLQSPVEVGIYNLRRLWMPKGARLSLTAQIVDTVPERVIHIEVPEVLKASIRIKCLGSPGYGILPPAVVADEADLKHYRTYGIDITMHVDYKWLSAASPAIPAYKQWVSFIFTRLEQLNSDNLQSQSTGN